MNEEVRYCSTLGVNITVQLMIAQYNSSESVHYIRKYLKKNFTNSQKIGVHLYHSIALNDHVSYNKLSSLEKVLRRQIV